MKFDFHASKLFFQPLDDDLLDDDELRFALLQSEKKKLESNVLNKLKRSPTEETAKPDQEQDFPSLGARPKTRKF